MLIYDNYHLKLTEIQNKELKQLQEVARNKLNRAIFRSTIIKVALAEYIEKCNKDNDYLVESLQKYLKI